MDDTADMMTCQYSVKYASRKWSLALFDDTVDMAAINAYILSTTLLPSSKREQEDTS
jgi:hypothetical protein